MGSLSAPGDPAALEQLSTRLRYAAQGVGSLGGNTRQFAAGTVADAEWTGTAAESFTAFGLNLGQGAAAAEEPLARMASAVETYAGYLRTAQQAVQAFNTVAGAAQAGASGAPMRAVEAAERSASDAVSLLQQAGQQAATEVTSAAGQLAGLFGDGPVQGFVSAQPGLAGEPPLGEWLPGEAISPGRWTQLLTTTGAPDLGVGPEVNLPAPDLGLPEVYPLPLALGPEILGNPGSGLLGPLFNFSKPDEGGEEPVGVGDDPEPPSEGIVDPRDVHGQDRTGSRDVDVDYVREHGELFFQDDGQLVRVLDNGNGTSDVVVYDPANPSGAETTSMKDMPESQVQSRVNSGRWFG